MPFQSPKQRRYMHANLPDIANRWEAKYGLGGIAELNSQLNSLPEYYMNSIPAAQGGRIGYQNSGLAGSSEAAQAWADLEADINEHEDSDWTAQAGIGGENPAFSRQVQAEIEKRQSEYEWDGSGDYQLELDKIALRTKAEMWEKYKLGRAHGGFIPSHQAGIYGLAEGGKIIEGQPHQLSYITPGEAQTLQNLGGRKTITSEGIPAYPPLGEAGTSPGTSSDHGQSSSSGGGDAGHLSHNVPQSLGGTKPDPAPDPDRGWQTYAIPDTKKVGGRNMLGDYDPNNTTGWKEKGLHIDSRGNETNPVDRGEMSAKDYNELLTETVEYINPKTDKLTTYTKKKQFGQKYEPPKKKSGFWGALGKGILTLATFGVLGPGAAKLASYYNTGKRIKSFADTKTINILGKKLDLTQHFDKTKSILNKRQIAEDKLLESLGPNHPESKAIQAKRATKKLRTRDEVPDGDGVNITMDVEKVNDANAEKTALEQKYREMDEASYAAWLRLQEVDKAKQEAYYKMFRDTYMSAQGGRVPAGYNTGGLSNLFRLKNV